MTQEQIRERAEFYLEKAKARVEAVGPETAGDKSYFRPFAHSPCSFPVSEFQASGGRHSSENS